MSKVPLAQLRSEALSLPPAERAELAHELISSLDGAPDPDAAEAWEKEILRRLTEVDDGSATTVDRAELTRRIQERMRRL
jgi:putative addiction module component (TIGR02574 family)